MAGYLPFAQKLTHPQTRTIRVSTRKETAKIHKQKCNRFWNVDQLVQVTAEVGRSQSIGVFLVQKVTKEGRAEICISKLSLSGTPCFVLVPPNLWLLQSLGPLPTTVPKHGGQEFDIEVPFLSEHSADIYSLHLDQM